MRGFFPSISYLTQVWNLSVDVWRVTITLQSWNTMATDATHAELEYERTMWCLQLVMLCWAVNAMLCWPVPLQPR